MPFTYILRFKLNTIENACIQGLLKAQVGILLLQIPLFQQAVLQMEVRFLLCPQEGLPRSDTLPEQNPIATSMETDYVGGGEGGGEGGGHPGKQILRPLITHRI